MGLFYHIHSGDYKLPFRRKPFGRMKTFPPEILLEGSLSKINNIAQKHNILQGNITKISYVFIKYCFFFSRILKSLQPLPRQHSAVIGCTKNCTKKPIGVTVHSHCVESFEGLYSDVGEGGIAVNCEKTQFFLNTL